MGQLSLFVVSLFYFYFIIIKPQLHIYIFVAVHGSTHRHIRAALLSLLCPPIIRSQLLPKLDDFMRCHLSNWDNTLVDNQQKTKEMAFLSSLNQIASIEWESMSGEFMPEFFKLVLGTLSLPINFPGTNYHRGFQARKHC
ncbi:cytochrome P450 85A1-like isoform X2 [Camellia sinensis]|uniref:cytochrome P450 85A1-like isoform X2 n=1 Tax=Camellia sinensis TaxID=4442 RepID=UPI001035E42D|nr:cytochrome P450 85A1-like isoform X2 [Camellia sinensis]